MRSSVASRNRIGPTQHRPIGCGSGFEAPPSVSLLRHIGGIKRMPTTNGPGAGLGERFPGAKSGSHSTLRCTSPVEKSG